MKKTLLAAALLAALAIGAQEPVLVPDRADPNPFYAYGEGMASSPALPMAVEWQGAQDARIAAATAESVLAAFVKDAASAEALLAKIQGAYDSDPLTLTQIAAVTQWVMGKEPCPLCFWKPSPAAGRKIWVAALEKTAANAKDEYVRTFCLQQLWWCGY